MSRILMCAKKKFLLPYDEKILIDYDNAQITPIAAWIKSRYDVSVVNEQFVPQTDIILVTVVYEENNFFGKTVTLTRLSQLIPDESALLCYLKNIQSAMEIQLEYGVLDGKIVSIHDIPSEKYGLRCNCICPGCGGALSARLGKSTSSSKKKKRHHFAHHKEACNLVQAQQTALHMLAKEIIEQEKLFAFPGYSVSIEEINWRDKFHNLCGMPNVIEVQKPYKAACQKVTLEERISDFIPDIIVERNGRVCLIEIAVTHFVDEEKQRKIDELRIPLVEVDLSPFIGQPMTRDLIKDILVNQFSNKRWLYYPKEKVLPQAEKEFSKLYETIQERREAERQEWLRRSQEQAKKEEQRKRKQEETTFLLEDLLEPNNYKYELQRLRSDVNVNAFLQTLHLKREITEELPFFLDIPITGEMVFACDRRIWQAAIFDQFIYFRKANDCGSVSLSLNNITACIKNHWSFVPIDWKLARSASVTINGREKRFSLFYGVVKKYLDYLHYLGFISRLYCGNGTVEYSKTITPPNEDCAILLKDAIERADPFDPNIDEFIDHILHPPYAQNPPYIPKRWRQWHEAKQVSNSNECDIDEPSSTRLIDQYSAGRLEVWNLDFNSAEPIFDQFGHHWVKCTNCGAIKREDEMISYGGKDSVNKGCCKSCK